MSLLRYGGVEAGKLRRPQPRGGSPVSGFCSMFSQVLKLLPRTEFQALVKRTHAERHARGFTCWGQFVAMLFCQLGRAHSLREICGGLDLTRFRGHCSPWGEEGAHDAEDPTAVSPATPGAARRAGSDRAHAGGVGPAVRAVCADHPELAPAGRPR